MSITLMTFVSVPEDQWQMVQEAIRQALDDTDLGHIAAGPLEGLLGRHGEECIGLIETEAARDQKFARAVTGVWKYTMTEEVWARVQAIKSRVPIELWLPEGRRYNTTQH